MKRRFTAVAILGGGVALALAGLVARSAPQAASEMTLPTMTLEDQIDGRHVAFYYSADSNAEAAQLSRSYERRLTIGSGDTLMKVLVDAGAGARDAYNAIEAMSALFKPRYLKPGHEIVVTLRAGAGDGAADTLVGFKLIESVERDVVVSRDGEGFTASTVDHPLTLDVAAANGVIENSLFLAGETAGVPAAVLADLIQVYSFDVDFQRDIRSGDGFSVMYERYLDESGAVVRTGNVLRASMTLSGKEHELYRFANADGQVDYYDVEGKSMRRTLMRTPINGARLSSGFGNRLHPILGFTKLHTGTDFAAPRGTPIYAAGSGTVEYAGTNGGYGTYVRIRHNGTYKTAYAHMSGIAKGVRVGTRVQQGQTIGYVGTTGRSTGPHLHYEVIRNGGFINSRTMHLPSGEQLKGANLESFMAMRETADAQYAMLTEPDSGSPSSELALANRSAPLPQGRSGIPGRPGAAAWIAALGSQ